MTILAPTLGPPLGRGIFIHVEGPLYDVSPRTPPPLRRADTGPSTTGPGARPSTPQGTPRGVIRNPTSSRGEPESQVETFYPITATGGRSIPPSFTGKNVSCAVTDTHPVGPFADQSARNESCPPSSRRAVCAIRGTSQSDSLRHGF